MNKLVTSSEVETFAWGEKLGTACRGGEAFLLCGDLGAGKTKLAQGIASGLGVLGRVNSPTFNILKLYQATGPVGFFCHIDAYRLESAVDLEALGIREHLSSPDTVTVIEWAEKVEGIWPKTAMLIKLRHLSGEHREITWSVNS